MKDALRAEARARLAAIPLDQRARAGAAIARSVWELPAVARASHLLVYASLASEVATGALVEEAIRRGITPVYPRCIPETREMTLHRVEPGRPLETGSHGIREPGADCPRVALETVDAALVPGLAWDRRGGRLGRGAGYYDRLLGSPAWSGFACGLFFAAQEFAEVPMEPWDARLDAVVTEEEVVNAR